MKILELEETPFHILRYLTSGRKGPEKASLPFHKARADHLPQGLEALVLTSDLQGRERNKVKNRLLGEAVAEELVKLQEKKEIPPVGLVALGGDLYDHPDCRKRGGTGDVTRVWNTFAKHFDDVIGVHGNHDIVCEPDLAFNAHALDGQCVDLQGIRIGGVSGIVGRPEKNHRKTLETFFLCLRRVLAKNPDLILLHQGPDDPDRGQHGDPHIRDFLEKKGSSLVIFGHTHWDAPLLNLGRHQLLNVDHRLVVLTA